jgi:pyruvate dehydrogenase E2 component (dihydrolipoamide acetyltransferase)
VAVEIKLPEMGEGIDAGTVVRILVKPGDTVAENQGLMELETDKALVEVPADSAGTVSAVLVKEGDKVKVGSTLVTLDGGTEAKAASAASEAQAGGQPTEADNAAATTTRQEQVAAGQSSAKQTKGGGKGESDAEGEQAAAAGGSPELNTIEHAKSSNGQAPTAGAVGAAPAQPSSTPPNTEQKSSGKEGRADATATNATGSSDEIIPAGPMTRRIARELNIDLRRLKGSGQNGRITPEDVYAAAREQMQRPAGVSGGVALPELPDFAKWGSVERQAMTQVRRLTAEHMALSWRTVPHVTQFEKIDITDLEELRKRYEPDMEKGGGKFTLTVPIIRAVVSALKAYPQFNSSLDEASGEIVYKQYYNIGIAVDTERGLLVPVLRDADRKDFPQLSLELVELADRARSGKIDVEDLRGGTFTISNQGGIGGAEFTPIVNWPEVAILGLGRARKEPAIVGDTVKPRLIMPVGLSYDHRVIDGAMAARFIRRLKESLETPERLLMGL